MHDSLGELIATCDLPRADRSCSLLTAIANQPRAGVACQA
jgi:hypothetical protein